MQGFMSYDLRGVCPVVLGHDTRGLRGALDTRLDDLQDGEAAQCLEIAVLTSNLTRPLARTHTLQHGEHSRCVDSSTDEAADRTRSQIIHESRLRSLHRNDLSSIS